MPALTVQQLGAARHRVDKLTGDTVEQFSRCCTHQCIVGCKLQAQTHLAGLIAQRLKSPLAAKAVKGSLDQFKRDGLIFLQGVTRAEALADAALGQLELGLDGVALAAEHPRIDAAIHVLRIGFNVIHQVEQLASAEG